MKQVFLVYPCGKRFRLMVPITIYKDGKAEYVYPGSNGYLAEAIRKYQIGKLKVIEEEVPGDNKPTTQGGFVSMARKMQFNK
jgi:hypothetical protein